MSQKKKQRYVIVKKINNFCNSYFTIIQNYTYNEEDKDFSEAFARKKLHSSTCERSTAQGQQWRLYLGWIVGATPIFEKTLL
jgi:hypothetical protein